MGPPGIEPEPKDFQSPVQTIYTITPLKIGPIAGSWTQIKRITVFYSSRWTTKAILNWYPDGESNTDMDVKSVWSSHLTYQGIKNWLEWRDSNSHLTH